MPRSSRHKSHRATHKRSSRDARDRSDSEEEGNSRDRKERGEERAAGSGTRVSRDSEPEHRKSSSKDQMRLENGDSSVVEHGKKRKHRVEDSAAADLRNGGGEDDGVVDEGFKGEGFGPVESEKTSKSNLLVVDSEGRSSRRREDSGGRYEETDGKVESAKRRSEKDLCRRESSSSSSSSSQYRDGKERDRERGSERDKKVQDYRHERSDDVTSRKKGIRTGSSEEERVVKKDDTEWQVQDVLCNPELQKKPEKHTRRGGGSGNNAKCQEDGRESDDRRLSSRDDRTKNHRYKDEMHKAERHKDERYRNKYREDRDRDLRHRDYRHQDEPSSRDHNSSRSYSEHLMDENKPSESQSKKNKFHDTDRDGSPCIEDGGIKSKDTRGRKRSSAENDNHSDVKLSAKEPHRDVEKNSLNTSKLEFLHPGKVDFSLSNNRPKSSASPSAHSTKDQSRCSAKQAETTQRESHSEERFRPSAASTRDRAELSGIHERVSESQSSEKNNPKYGINSEELLIETAAASQYDRTSRSDGHISPIHLTEKSPSTTSDQRLSNRSGAKLRVNIEDVGQKSSASKDGREYSSVDDRELELPLENLTVDNHSQTNLQNSELIPVDSSSINRTSHLSGNSPGHLPLLPPVRLGIDSPLVLGSYEDDNRVKIGNRKSNSRYKRNSDINMERGQGNPWASGPTWPTPVPSGFIPFQNGPPPPGFHSAIQQFPAPSLFGMRPSLDMNLTGVSYHVHEMDDRFSSYGHSFGSWHNPVDDSFPQMQGWDGRNRVFGDKCHVYGKPDWDQNRHLMGSQGWEMNAFMWKGQSGSMNMEFSIPQKETEYSTQAVAGEARVEQSGSQSCNEWAHSEHAPDEITEMRRTSNIPTKDAVEKTQKTIPEKAPGPYKTPNNDRQFCCNYLSKLDISIDLARLELYKQCMTLLPTKDPRGVSNASKQGDAKNLKEEIKVAVKGQNLNSLFPTISDAIFQRAMSLYKERSETTKVKLPALPFCSNEKKDSLEALDMEKAEAVCSQTSEDPSLACSNSSSKAEQGISTIIDAEGDIPSDTQKQPSDKFPDVFVDGSQASATLPPECRVDLRRIHISPESTH